MDAVTEALESAKKSTPTPMQEALPGVDITQGPEREANPKTQAVEAQAEPGEEPRTDESVEAAPSEHADDAAHGALDRRRIEEQLDALKRKESELRRALAIADHPELEDGIRMIEGCTFGVSRVEAKMAQGLSKSEERRCETIDKKLSALRVKREEIDAQIKDLESELFALTEERKRAFEQERREALERLIAALGQHEGSLRAVGLDSVSLIPDLGRFMPEVTRMAETLVAARPKSKS